MRKRFSYDFKFKVAVEALKNEETSVEIAARPEIFNTDHGSQFTSNKFISTLMNKQVKISMDGKGRGLDNIFIERF